MQLTNNYPLQNESNNKLSNRFTEVAAEGSTPPLPYHATAARIRNKPS
jgi:hypothetical protein